MFKMFHPSMSILDQFPEMVKNNVYRYYKNGTWHESETEEKVPIYNPYDKTIVGYIQNCSKKELNQIISVAKEAQPCWEDTSLQKRAKVLKKAADIMDDWADELGELLVKENGKPRSSAVGEITRTAEIFRFTAEAGLQIEGKTYMGDAFKGYSRGKMSITYRVPLGVILCISPFNYPFNLAGSKIAPALMAGNSVVMKAATEGTITTLYIGEILKKAGIPNGVFNIATGKGSQIGDYLVQHPEINMVSFTGSSKIGKHIADIAGMKPLLLELGGKDAAIVIEDAKLEETATKIVEGAFSYSGQRCTAVKRVLPLPEIADSLIELIVEKAQNLSIGNPADDKAIGPLISTKQADYVQELIDDALEKGAQLLLGNHREGDIHWPTVLDQVTIDMRVAWEEPFGPVLPIIRVKDIAEAIEISNKSQYGLQGMVFTENIDLAFNIAQELEVGTVQINGASSRGPDHFPFLGVKSSGLGTQGIKYSILSMSRPKSIEMNLSESGALIPKRCQ